jgi:hypothetical protein
MTKLTLSVDEKVVRGAKRYTAVRATSVSRLVEGCLHLLSRTTTWNDTRAASSRGR